MATAKKLPSGQYRCRAYVGKDADGKKIIKSFTAKSKAMAEHMASDYVLNHKAEPAASSMTFGAALDKYIRTGVCEDEKVKERIDTLHVRNLFKLKTIPCFPGA